MDYVSTKTKINGHRVSSVNMDMNSFSKNMDMNKKKLPEDHMSATDLGVPAENTSGPSCAAESR